MKPVVVIDLFAGAGGFTEGALAAGAKVAVSIDFWEPAVLLHRHNQPNVLMVQHELGNLVKDVQLIRKYLARYPNHHVHLHGSPPCQALSNASRTNASQGMGMVLHFLDLVDAIQPDSWSMENVVPMRKRLPEGTPSIILNSADYGVPQTRRRCIAGEGWEAIPTHSKDEWRSVLDALPHLADSPRTICVNLDGCGESNSRRAKSADVAIDEPSLTVRGAVGAPSIRDTSTDIPVKIRSLTVKETATLQGFPATFEWELPGLCKKDIWTAIGNAVCPPVAEAIIRGIIQ